MPCTIIVSAVERLPVEMWHRILSLAIHIPHLDSTYDDAFLQSRRNCSVQAVQHAIKASRITARVLAKVCSSWREFIEQNEHQAIVLTSHHDWAAFLATIRRWGDHSATVENKEMELEIETEMETEKDAGAQVLPVLVLSPRLLTATRRIDVLFSLGEIEVEVHTYLRGLEEIIRACPNLSTLRVQEPAYPRLLRSQETTNILHKWPSTIKEPDGGGGAGGGGGVIGTAANRLHAFHFHPQFDNEHFERALDWSTVPGLGRTFANLRLLSCTIAFSSRWDEFRPPFTTESVRISFPNMQILHIAWMMDEASVLAGFDEAAVHLPQYFRQWDLPRLRHLRVHRINSASWGIILALLNKNSPQLESLSINEVDDDYGSIPKQFWEQCPNVTTLMGELERFDSLGIPTGHKSLRQLGYTRPSSHFGDNTHFREKTVREIGEQIEYDFVTLPDLTIRFVECSFHELCIEASWLGTVIVPPLIEELRSLASICTSRGYSLLDGDGMEVSSFFRQACKGNDV